MSLLILRGLRSSLAGPFDLTLAPGECITITGPSGAGKSLFLRMIADLDPSQGDVLLTGRSRHQWTPPEWRRRVTYCPAEPGWWTDRVADHIPPARTHAARALMPALALRPELFDAPVSQLSTGERQRMALIRALVLGSDVLLLDEPTGSLDEDSTTRVEQLLRDRLTRGTAMLMVTHNPAQARRLGTRHLRMHERRLACPESAGSWACRAQGWGGGCAQNETHGPDFLRKSGS